MLDSQLDRVPLAAQLVEISTVDARHPTQKVVFVGANGEGFWIGRVLEILHQKELLTKVCERGARLRGGLRVAHTVDEKADRIPTLTIRRGDHSGLREEKVAAQRQVALDAAYAAHPERFPNGPPIVRRPPESVAINPLSVEEATTEPLAAGVASHEVVAPPAISSRPTRRSRKAGRSRSSLGEAIPS